MPNAGPLAVARATRHGRLTPRPTSPRRPKTRRWPRRPPWRPTRTPPRRGSASSSSCSPPARPPSTGCRPNATGRAKPGLTTSCASCAPPSSGPKASHARLMPVSRRQRQPREGSKEAHVIAMLRRPEGATIAQIMAEHRLASAYLSRVLRRRAEEEARARRHLGEAGRRRAHLPAGRVTEAAMPAHPAAAAGRCADRHRRRHDHPEPEPQVCDAEAAGRIVLLCRQGGGAALRQDRHRQRGSARRLQATAARGNRAIAFRTGDVAGPHARWQSSRRHTLGLPRKLFAGRTNASGRSR